MPIVLLPDRTVIRVAGPDAEQFLHNVITTDVAGLGEAEARPGALLTPQGRVLFDFLIARDGANGFRLDCRKDVADDLQRRLTLYRLRAKAEISKPDESLVPPAGKTNSTSSHAAFTGSGDLLALADRRFPAEAAVERVYGGSIAATAGREAWDRLRIRHGIAESGADFRSETFSRTTCCSTRWRGRLPKGCYVGQEVVSRMQHRGTARRRVLIVAADDPLPPPGTELRSTAGRWGRSARVSPAMIGLAIVRIDRVKGRKAPAAGHGRGVDIGLTIPSWARFAFPDMPGYGGREG